MFLRKYKLFFSILLVILIIVLGIIIFNFFFKKLVSEIHISSHTFVSQTKDFGIDAPSGWGNNLIIAGTSTATSTRGYSSLGIPAIFTIGTTTPNLFQNTDPVIFVTDRFIIKDSKYKDPANVSSVSDYANKVKQNFVPIALQPASNYKLIEDEAVTLKDGTPAYLIGNSFDSNLPIFDQSKFVSSKKNTKIVLPNKISTSKTILHYRGLYLIILTKNRLYVVTATADQSKWGEYVDAFKQTLLNFQINNKI